MASFPTHSPRICKREIVRHIPTFDKFRGRRNKHFPVPIEHTVILPAGYVIIFVNGPCRFGGPQDHVARSDFSSSRVFRCRVLSFLSYVSVIASPRFRPLWTTSSYLRGNPAFDLGLNPADGPRPERYWARKRAVCSVLIDCAAAESSPRLYCGKSKDHIRHVRTSMEVLRGDSKEGDCGLGRLIECPR
jgi:hypothetical protein